MKRITLGLGFFARVSVLSVLSVGAAGLLATGCKKEEPLPPCPPLNR